MNILYQNICGRNFPSFLLPSMARDLFLLLKGYEFSVSIVLLSYIRIDRKPKCVRTCHQAWTRKKDGLAKIGRIRASFRNDSPHFIGRIQVSAIEITSSYTPKIDGLSEPISLPEADVIKFFLEDVSWICIRPSCTEPKCKFYFGVRKESMVEG